MWMVFTIAGMGDTTNYVKTKKLVRHGGHLLRVITRIAVTYTPDSMYLGTRNYTEHGLTYMLAVVLRERNAAISIGVRAPR